MSEDKPVRKPPREGSRRPGRPKLVEDAWLAAVRIEIVREIKAEMVGALPPANGGHYTTAELLRMLAARLEGGRDGTLGG